MEEPLDSNVIDIEAKKMELVNESKQCKYPMSNPGIKFRYRNVAYDLHRVSIGQFEHIGLK